jgi:hypothetical protein
LYYGFGVVGTVVVDVGVVGVTVGVVAAGVCVVVVGVVVAGFVVVVVVGVVVVGVVVVGVVVVGFGVVVVGVVVVGVVVVVVGFVVVVAAGVVVVVVGFVVDGVVVVAFFSPQPARPRMSPTLNSTQIAETIKTRRFIASSSPCLTFRPVELRHPHRILAREPCTSYLSDYSSRERCQVAGTARPLSQVYPNKRGKGTRREGTAVQSPSRRKRF